MSDFDCPRPPLERRSLSVVLPDGRTVVPLAGCTLVDLPDGYAGPQPLRDGQVIARLTEGRDPGPAACCEECGCQDEPFFAVVLNDGETYTDLTGCQLIETTACQDEDCLPSGRVALRFASPEPQAGAGAATDTPWPSAPAPSPPVSEPAPDTTYADVCTTFDRDRVKRFYGPVLVELVAALEDRSGVPEAEIWRRWEDAGVEDIMVWDQLGPILDDLEDWLVPQDEDTPRV